MSADLQVTFTDISVEFLSLLSVPMEGLLPAIAIPLPVRRDVFMTCGLSLLQKPGDPVSVLTTALRIVPAAVSTCGTAPPLCATETY